MTVKNHLRRSGQASAPVLPRRSAKDDHGGRDNPEESPYTPLAGGRRLYPPVKGG